MNAAIDDCTEDLIPQKLKGIFSSLAMPGKIVVPGAPKLLWFARQDGDGQVRVQLLDEYGLPSQQKVFMTAKDSFLKNFTLEPDLTYRMLNQRVLKGDRYREQDQNIEAKIEYQSVLRVDEENIRANFGLGLAYLALNQIDKARYTLEKLVQIDESFSLEHKHLFNAFGIALRKKKLFNEALSFYNRARQICDSDENLILNMARARFENGDANLAYADLQTCLELAPDFPEALAFLAWLRKNNIKPADRELRAYFDRLEMLRGALPPPPDDVGLTT
jgi:tetratricopeptide (TPR) repeat protein